MRTAITYAVGLGCVGMAVMAAAQESGQSPRGPNPDSQYRLGPDSLPQEGVPKGEIRGPFTLPSRVYPGTEHTYWIYVPAQYDPAVPAALMVFQDGQAFKNENGDMRAQNVMDNLIYRREIPVMIGVFINPGRRPDQPEPTPKEWGDRNTNRPTEYNSLDDRYARVIAEELMPALEKDYNIAKDPEMHGIGGSSSGAIAAFTVAWERPDHFRKVLSNVGSFVNLRGGHVYPEKVLAAARKPIRVYLCDGRNDNRGLRRDGNYDETRDWFYQNVRLMKALTQKGYDVNYAWGMNNHGQKFGGAILPDMMRWLWRDGPVSTDPKDMLERGFRQPAARKEPVHAVDGRLVRPADYREWVYVTTGLGMTYGPAETAKGQEPRFDNVFVTRAAYREFLETGIWPEKTMFMLEVRTAEANVSIDIGGRTQGGVVALEAAVKDRNRFPDGGWGYYSFDGPDGPLESATPLPATAPCYSCHREKAAVEHTFVQFYPTLFEVAKRRGTVRPDYDPARGRSSAGRYRGSDRSAP